MLVAFSIPEPDAADAAPSPESGPDESFAAESVSEAELFNLVYSQMRSLAANANDFDDLVQIAAESAFRMLPRFEGRSRLSTWTYRICYNTWLKQRRFYNRWLARFAFSDDGTLPSIAATGSFGEGALEERERLLALHQALAQIPERRRAVVMLHDLEGHSIEDIATIVGVLPLTVRSRLRDGRKVLLRHLASNPYFGQDACEGGLP